MIDPVHFYALYGPGMVFALAMGEDGEFAFSLAGNMEPLFPLRLMGEWEGRDLARVATLRQKALELSLVTPSNAPTLPDSAFLSIGQVQDGVMKGGEYALYDLPEKIASVFNEVLALVHGDWLADAAEVLRADCHLLSVRPVVSAEITIESTGKNAVQFANPLLPDVYKVFLLDPVTDNTVEPKLSELRVSSNGLEANTPTMKLAPGDQLSLTVDILTEIPAGNWELHIAMELPAGNPPTDDLRTGIISWEPFQIITAFS